MGIQRARVQDWGSYVQWNGSVIMPFGRLVELGLCDCVITKGGQSGPGLSTAANLAAARAAGVKVSGCFYWVDPCNSVDVDVAHISALVEAENPDIIVLDIEQWWSSWQKYEDAINKLLPWAAVPHFAPAGLSNHYCQVSRAIKAAFPGKKVIIYTSRAFVLGWAAVMAAWLPEFDGGFVASWPDYGKLVYYLDWPEIEAYPPADCSPALPPGWETWSIWQTSSRIKPAEYQKEFGGFNHNYDWGVFNGSVAELQAWAGLPAKPADPEPKELSDHEKITRLWIAHPELQKAV